MRAYPDIVETVKKRIYDNSTDIALLNDDLADHPEVGTKEYRTSEKMVALLKNKGFNVEYPFAGLGTAYKAIHGSNDHRHKVAIVAEYDALPGIGHGCGHCLSGSMSLLAGIALSEIQDEIDTDIHIIGTPDEEYYGGKPQLIRAGAFDGYDMAMMIHLYHYNQVYTKTLAMDTYTYYFQGQAAHASACPWDGKNAFNASQFFFHAIDMLRQHVTPDVRIHGMIRYAGEAPNIIPAKNEVEMYIRALERNNLDSVVKKVDDCARGAAIATQTSWEKRATAEKYDNMMYLPFGLSQLTEVYDEMNLDLDGDQEQIFGSSDMGNVSMICPSFHSTLRISGPDIPLHTKEFADLMKTDKAHQLLETGAEVIARQTIKIFSDDEKIKTLKKEFEEYTR